MLLSPPSYESTLLPCTIPSGTGSGVVGSGVLPEDLLSPSRIEKEVERRASCMSLESEKEFNKKSVSINEISQGMNSDQFLKQLIDEALGKKQLAPPNDSLSPRRSPEQIASDDLKPQISTYEVPALDEMLLSTGVGRIQQLNKLPEMMSRNMSPPPPQHASPYRRVSVVKLPPTETDFIQPPQRNFIIEETPETILLLPNVRCDWYRSLGPTENVVLSNSVCIDIATTLNMPASSVRIVSSSPHESGTVLYLELIADASMKRLFNEIVSKGQLPLVKTTQTLRDIGWLAHEDAVRHHEEIARWHAGIPTEQQEEQKQIAVLEKLANDLRIGLETYTYAIASGAAQALFIDHPYRGMPILCEIIKRFYHNLSVQEISIQWRDLIDNYCKTQGQSAVRSSPTVFDKIPSSPVIAVKPIHHSVIVAKKESLMASKAQTQALQGMLNSRKIRLSELQNSTQENADNDVVIFEGERGKVVVSSPKKQPPPSTLQHAQLKEYTRRVVGGSEQPPLIAFDSI